MIVKGDKAIGKDGQHKKFILQYGEGKNIEALFFNCPQEINRGDVIDVVFYVTKNNFRGLVTPQLMIKDILSVKMQNIMI